MFSDLNFCNFELNVNCLELFYIDINKNVKFQHYKIFQIRLFNEYASMKNKEVTDLGSILILIKLIQNFQFSVILNSFVKKEIFVPLGRLIYSTLLGSFILQLYDASSLRKPIATVSRYNIVSWLKIILCSFIIYENDGFFTDNYLNFFFFKFWMTSADVLLSFTVAFLMYLFLEGPINRMIKETVR